MNVCHLQQTLHSFVTKWPIGSSGICVTGHLTFVQPELSPIPSRMSKWGVPFLYFQNYVMQETGAMLNPFSS
jgi:hypothetical protein